MDRLRVAIRTDDDPITMHGVTACLRGHSQIQLVPADQLAPSDVLIVAVDRVGRDTMTYLRAMEKSKSVRVLLLTDGFDAQSVLAAVEYGVVGVLPRTGTTPAQLINAITAANADQAILSTALQGELLRQVKRLQRKTLQPLGLGITGLDDRELEILRLLADGLLTKAIATKLNYSDRTVKNVVQRLIDKVDASNRTHAVAIALRAGVI
ncbi:response regulator transcription factor [Saccharopolyspora shandongensis]|uniref:DNA-binding response regulator, NarL/FixJ family, contains REC and HTH domains n=1 Tax=Saccharopolyspora shandongensis TaxID=418495 RepID=A0A1H3MSD4_9PSEU|nr:response regulator transcription factor [Saccharopolyspora shandongensis]SDY79410.1 DNA-binding response regulator, NarL/FixJ family, contains REC and HTH domains [Saccharopolyspora shandongensis]